MGAVRGHGGGWKMTYFGNPSRRNSQKKTYLKTLSYSNKMLLVILTQTLSIMQPWHTDTNHHFKGIETNELYKRGRCYTSEMIRRLYLLLNICFFSFLIRWLNASENESFPVFSKETLFYFSTQNISPIYSKLKMVRLCWLFVMMAFMCSPGFGSLCSVCNDFNQLDKILVSSASSQTCLHLNTCWSFSWGTALGRTLTENIQEPLVLFDHSQQSFKINE